MTTRVRRNLVLRPFMWAQWRWAIATGRVGEHKSVRMRRAETALRWLCGAPLPGQRHRP